MIVDALFLLLKILGIVLLILIARAVQLNSRTQA